MSSRTRTHRDTVAVNVIDSPVSFVGTTWYTVSGRQRPLGLWPAVGKGKGKPVPGAQGKPTRRDSDAQSIRTRGVCTDALAHRSPGVTSFGQPQRVASSSPPRRERGVCCISLHSMPLQHPASSHPARPARCGIARAGQIAPPDEGTIKLSCVSVIQSQCGLRRGSFMPAPRPARKNSASPTSTHLKEIFWRGPHNATDVWSIKKVNPQNMVHLTEKPVELARRALEYSSRLGENVLDLFGGSGSTLIAAEQTGRTAFVMEIDPLYCDVIVRRWEQFTGRTAEHRSLRSA